MSNLFLQNFIANAANVVAQQLQNFVTHMHAMSRVTVTTLALIALLLIFNL